MGDASVLCCIHGRGFRSGLCVGAGLKGRSRVSSRRCTQGGAGLELSAGNITNPEFQVAAVSWLTTAIHKHSVSRELQSYRDAASQCNIEMQSRVIWRKEIKCLSSHYFNTKSDFLSCQSFCYFT